MVVAEAAKPHGVVDDPPDVGTRIVMDESGHRQTEERVESHEGGRRRLEPGGIERHRRTSERTTAQACVASRSISARLRSTPHRYPDNAPSPRTTRWHGIATASLLAPQALATARTAAGEPILRATSA